MDASPRPLNERLPSLACCVSSWHRRRSQDPSRLRVGHNDRTDERFSLNLLWSHPPRAVSPTRATLKTESLSACLTRVQILQSDDGTRIGSGSGPRKVSASFFPASDAFKQDNLIDFRELDF